MASLSVPCPKCVVSISSSTPLSTNRLNPSLVSFPNAYPHSNIIKSGFLRLLAPVIGIHPELNQAASILAYQKRQTVGQISASKLQAQVGEVPIRESFNTILQSKASRKEDPASVIPDAASINAFMKHVSDLVKLVDSRDIIELELKQQDCELLIRKKEATPLPPAPVAAAQPSYYAAPPQPQPQASAAAAPSSAPSFPAPPKASASSHPTLKCPMAGTFYRCPGPGEPPFVKVGDKVQKGQLICIIEAMKLMNEIEADQSGTISEILVEDGKPVSVDMPLFVITP